MAKFFAVAVSLAIGCGGCAVLSSETLEQLNKDDRAPRGTYYALPKGVVTATLQANQQDVAFTLTIDGPTYVPDLAHAYYLGYRSHPSYKDDIRITTTKEGLLTRVASSTTDQTPGIILNLVKAAVGGGEPTPAVDVLKLEDASASIELLKLVFDPLDGDQREKTEAAINAAIVAFRDKMRISCRFNAAATTSPAQQSRAFYEAQLLSKMASKPLVETLKTDAGEAVKTARTAYTTLVGKTDQVSCSPTPTANPTIDAARLAYCKAITQDAAAATKVAEITSAITTLQASLTALDLAQKTQEAYCPAYANMTSPPRAHISVRDYSGSRRTIDTTATDWSPKVAAARTEVDCTAGICYRPKEPFRIEYSLGEGKDTLLAELPNAADLVLIDIRRAFLIQKLQDITFDADGFIQIVKIQKGSELLEASKIPVNVLSAIATGLTARATVTNRRATLATEEGLLIDAESQLAAAQAAKESAAVGATTGFESATLSKARARLAPRGATSKGAVP